MVVSCLDQVDRIVLGDHLADMHGAILRPAPWCHCGRSGGQLRSDQMKETLLRGLRTLAHVPVDIFWIVVVVLMTVVELALTPPGLILALWLAWYFGDPSGLPFF